MKAFLSSDEVVENKHVVELEKSGEVYNLISNGVITQMTPELRETIKHLSFDEIFS